MTVNNVLLVIDGNNLAHRCKYVFSLSNKGVDVSVTYGVIKVLLSLIQKFKPYSVLVCWDGGTPEYRRKNVAEYKANRTGKYDDEVAYEDFLRQMNELDNYALPLMGVLSVKKLGAEADDLMANASMLHYGNTVVVTSDKDLLQVITDKTQVYNPSNKTLYTSKEVIDQYGVTPIDFIEWRALQGDSSDNIPGIKGVGEKTATKLLEEFGDLSGVVNAALGINPKGVVSGKLKDSILEFGMDRLIKNVYISTLLFDRTGSRLELLSALSWYTPYNPKRFKKYVLVNSFVSLLDGEVLGHLKHLQCPDFQEEDIRTPVVCSRRFPT